MTQVEVCNRRAFWCNHTEQLNLLQTLHKPMVFSPGLWSSNEPFLVVENCQDVGHGTSKGRDARIFREYLDAEIKRREEEWEGICRIEREIRERHRRLIPSVPWREIEESIQKELAERVQRN